MILKIITPSFLLEKNPVEKVFLPGSEGAFEVLKNHAPIIAQLGKGLVRWDTDGSQAISSGFVEVSDDVITVVAETE